MKIWLVLPGDYPKPGKRIPMRLPYPDADHAVLASDCPVCGSRDCKLQGTGRRPSTDDRAWEADAVALCCDRHVGTLRCEPSTLFGVREDERIASMGIRIY